MLLYLDMILYVYKFDINYFFIEINKLAVKKFQIILVNFNSYMQEK